MLDLGELRGWDYYSGIHLEGYADGFGAELVSGGRYDHLLERFGPPGPATGFAFDVNRLLLAQEAQGVEPVLPGPEVFVIDFTEDKDDRAGALPPVPRRRARRVPGHHEPAGTASRSPMRANTAPPGRS